MELSCNHFIKSFLFLEWSDIAAFMLLVWVMFVLPDLFPKG